MLYIVTDTDVLAVNYTLELDVYSGIYNLTVYISLLRDDPLLFASINGFNVRLFSQPPSESIDLSVADNKVII